MVKKILLITGLVVVIGLLGYGAINRVYAQSTNGGGHQGRGGTDLQADGNTQGLFRPEAYSGGEGGTGRGRGSNSSQLEQDALLLADKSSLSEAEAASLLFMREEEKLAHDVYVALYEKWNLQTFQNIAQSEQLHTDSVKTLIDRYGLTDPASSEAGVFTNLELQKLYDTLISRGSQSLEESLRVGAAVEEIDIQDLDKRLAENDNADIARVFERLKFASGNHLRAFVTNLENQTGASYQPQYLTQDAYQAIVNARPGNRGNGGGGRGGGGGNGRP